MTLPASGAPPYPKALALYPRLRQSTLAQFDNCALTTKWSLEHEGHRWSSHPAARGQLVHRVLARCMRIMVEQGEQRIPVEVALAEFDDVIRQADIPMESVEGDSVSPIPLREIAQARVDVICWAKGGSWDVRDVVGIEKRLEATITYPDGLGGVVERLFTGRPDLMLINQAGWHAIIPDWKSSWALPPERVETEVEEDEAISEEGYFQQRGYALLTFLTYPGIQRVTLREVYVRHMTSETQKPTREASIHRYELPVLLAEFSALVERFDRCVEEDVWKPAPGAHCNFCLRPDDCPIFPQARREGRVTSSQEAELVGSRINVAEAVLRRLRASLRPWTNRYGPIKIRDAKRDRLWGPVIRSRTSRPSEEEVAWAMANGIEPASLFRKQTVTKFEAYNPADAPPQLKQAAEAEAMLLAAQKRSAASRKGHRARKAKPAPAKRTRRHNGPGKEG